MAWLWYWIVSFLVWLSADPHRLATEPARAAAAVAAARAAVVDQGGVRAGVEGVAASTPLFDDNVMNAKKACTTGTCR